MSNPKQKKKIIESYFLTRARAAGVPIPTGEICGEEPDFRFQTADGSLGIEVSELMRPASSNNGIVPVEQESFHEAIIRAAQREYDRVPGALPIHANVYFADARGKRQNKQDMIRSLVEVVRANANRAKPSVTLERPNLPEGFSFVTIISEARDWWTGEVGGYTVDHIYEQLAERIKEKDALVSRYRANLMSNSQVWLLLYTGVTVARSMSIPYGIEQRSFPFSFDRVFWFVDLENQYVEIRGSDLAI